MTNYFICFTGLTAVESGKLSNYFHFREPIRLHQKSLTHRQALDKSVHFLDTIDEDIPKGISFFHINDDGRSVNI